MSETQTIHNTVHLREDPYTRVLNSMIKDSRLSFKARGLLVFMLSQPSNWTTRVGWIESQATEGREAIRSALEELETLGYLRRKKVKDESGQFTSFAYHWHDCPPEDGNPSDGNPLTATRQTATRPLQMKEEETKENKHIEVGSDTRPQKPKEKEIAIKTRVHSWFNRRASTKWSKKESTALTALTLAYADATNEELAEDLDVLEWYYTKSGCKFCRRDPYTLLNNWPSEIDRAKTYQPE